MKLAHLLTALGLASMATVSAYAAPVTLDFEGVGNGAEVLEFYNGGTDSQGNRGTNYGVSFSAGAFAQRNADGIYIRGSNFTVNYDASLAFVDTNDPFRPGSWNVSYIYRTPVNVFAGVVFTTGGRDDFFLPATTPNVFGDPGRFEGILQGSSEPVVQITFQNIALDNFTLAATSTPVGRAGSTDIPEPASWALVGIGALGLIAARRKRKG